MIGVFLAFDIILFYVFFELTLVPLFFLIGIWGGPERRLRGPQVLHLHPGRQPHHAAGRAWQSVLVVSMPTTGRLTFSIPELVGPSTQRLATAVPATSPTGARAVLGLPGPDRRASRSRCRWCRSTPGCRWPTSRRRRPAACCWPACC